MAALMVAVWQRRAADTSPLAALLARGAARVQALPMEALLAWRHASMGRV